MMNQMPTLFHQTRFFFFFFQKGSTYTMDIKQKVGGKPIQYVKLTPTNAKDQRKEILIGIDTKTKQIYNLIELGKTEQKQR